MIVTVYDWVQIRLRRIEIADEILRKANNETEAINSQFYGEAFVFYPIYFKTFISLPWDMGNAFVKVGFHKVSLSLLIFIYSSTYAKQNRFEFIRSPISNI